MFNANKILIVTLAALGLSACGRDNYNGQYTGSQVQIPQAQTGQTGQTGQYSPYNYQAYGSTQYASVTADLQHNGDVVTGQYTANNSMMANYYPANPTGTSATTGQQYRFEASADQSDHLNSVRLIPMNSYMGAGCILEGSLQSIDHGARLTGTLNPTTTGYQSGYSLCLPTQITLDRAGN